MAVTTVVLRVLSLLGIAGYALEARDAREELVALRREFGDSLDGLEDSDTADEFGDVGAPVGTTPNDDPDARFEVEDDCPASVVDTLYAEAVPMEFSVIHHRCGPRFAWAVVVEDGSFHGWGVLLTVDPPSVVAVEEAACSADVGMTQEEANTLAPGGWSFSC